MVSSVRQSPRTNSEKKLMISNGVFFPETEEPSEWKTVLYVSQLLRTSCIVCTVSSRFEGVAEERLA